MLNNKILLVEDEPTIRDELAKFLNRYTNNDLYIGKNGKEGLELYRKYKPDIVISDIKMSEMNGIEMVRKIKKINPEQAVIFTTAHSDNSFFLEAIDIQVDGYLLKPVDLHLLGRKIKEISKHIMLKKSYNIQKTVMNEIAHLQGNMLAVLNEEMHPLFLNDKLLEFWNVDTIEEIKDNDHAMQSRFIKRDDCFYPLDNDEDWLVQIQKVDPSKRLVTMADLNGSTPKTYMVYISFVESSKHTIIVFSEITKMIKENREYKKQAYTDDLTQLYNRAMFDKQFGIAVNEAISRSEDLSIIILDLDHFKRINDVYGHLVGDDILIELSNHLRKKIRTNDILARWGGEEFVLILQNTDMQGAVTLAEHIRKSIEGHKFTNKIRLTCSFGVAGLEDAKETAVSLFKKADEALYRAKLNGRNRVVSY